MNNACFKINYLKVLSVVLILLWAAESSKAQPEKTSPEKSWETLNCTGAPTARHEDSFVEVGNKFYLLGGRGIKPVDIFDPV